MNSLPTSSPQSTVLIHHLLFPKFIYGNGLRDLPFHVPRLFSDHAWLPVNLVASLMYMFGHRGQFYVAHPCVALVLSDTLLRCSIRLLDVDFRASFGNQ